MDIVLSLKDCAGDATELNADVAGVLGVSPSKLVLLLAVHSSDADCLWELMGDRARELAQFEGASSALFLEVQGLTNRRAATVPLASTS